MADSVASPVPCLVLLLTNAHFGFCPGKAWRVPSWQRCGPLPSGALAHLVQDGDPRGLQQLPLQQGKWVDGIRLHVGGVAREQVGQADAGRTIAWGERAGSEDQHFEVWELTTA